MWPGPNYTFEQQQFRLKRRRSSFILYGVICQNKISRKTRRGWPLFEFARCHVLQYNGEEPRTNPVYNKGILRLINKCVIDIDIFVIEISLIYSLCLLSSPIYNNHLQCTSTYQLQNMAYYALNQKNCIYINSYFQLVYIPTDDIIFFLHSIYFFGRMDFVRTVGSLLRYSLDIRMTFFKFKPIFMYICLYPIIETIKNILVIL